MFENVAYEKWTGRKLYHWLKFDLNFRTKNNKNLSLGNIFKLLENHFYYGSYEFPKKSGNWYKGKHEPIISKEVFDLVQQQVKTQFVRAESKEFAFTKLMTCGLCGSSITADENLRSNRMETYIDMFTMDVQRRKTRIVNVVILRKRS